MFARFFSRPDWPLPNLPLDTNGKSFLRPFKDDDAQAYHAQILATLDIPGTAQHMLTFPSPFTLHHARRRIRQTHKWLEKNRGWSLALTTEGQFAGQIQIVCALPRCRRAEIAYWIAPEFRGRGLARRGVKTLIEAARDHWPLEKIEATVAPTNEDSIALLTNLDFTRSELAPVPYRVQGHWRRRSANLLIFTRDA